jgi:ADP-heptose:LPS heptosyltransferase
VNLFPSNAEEEFAANYELKENAGRRQWIGVHVGSGSTKNLILKRWPLNRWSELFELIRGNSDRRILLFGGPEEKEAHAYFLNQFPGLCVVAPTRNLREVGPLMKKCSAFISVDTALMHIAAAVEVASQIVIEGVTLNPTNFPFRQTPYSVARNPLIKNRYLDFYRYDGHPIRATDEQMRVIMSAVQAEEVFRLLPS